ncbi:MAG: methionine adenosyltransferase [Bacteroidales bacterium OttesenSCG-928-I14]|jgi:S-adenosylmethionine synthetase|nr:methionine adenosyltransferase [Bacteroidales bacterium OttesenSCG-928-I14]
MSYLFTSESVSEGHPDKIADQISDAVLDHFLAYDSDAKVACETLVTSGQVILAGEVKSKVYLDISEIVRDVIERIGYTKKEYAFEAKSSGIISLIHEQSKDIIRGIEKKNPIDQGAGDQGMMFGYATSETDNYIPLSLDLSHQLMKELANIRKYDSDLMPYLRPDAKSQVTICYNDNNVPESIDTIVISTQHDEFAPDKIMQTRIMSDIKNILIPRVKAKYSIKVQNLFSKKIKYFINSTGKFVIGGPQGDTGLTGRKIIVDTYGGKGAHGGGAFSGKDPSKVDRSAAYAARHIAKNLVAAGVCEEVLVQVSYAIGVANPMNIFINTYGKSNVCLTDNQIAEKVLELFDMRPKSIEKRLKLLSPIYTETAVYGHMGRKTKKIKKIFTSNYSDELVKMEVELFTWEKLDYVEKIKAIIQ